MSACKRQKRVTVKPFVKWAGGKGQILDRIRENYPKELGKSITKYVEPFVGGGAVLFDILSNYDMEAVYIFDTNSELMLTYQMIKSNAIKKWLKFRSNPSDGKNPQNVLFVMEDIMFAMRKDMGLKKMKKGNLLGFFVNDIDTLKKTVKSQHK